MVVKTKIQVNLAELKRWYIDLKQKWEALERLEPSESIYYQKYVVQGTAFGWPLQNSTEPHFQNSPFCRSRTGQKDLESLTYTTFNHYACGYAEKVLSYFTEAHLSRVYVLESGFEWNWHVDSPHSQRMVIAIETNEKSFILFDRNKEDKFHIPADGYVYVIDSRKEHKAYNHGGAERVHLLWSMQSKDVSKYLNNEVLL